MKKRTVTLVELRALQTLTYAMGLAIGFGLFTSWSQVAVGTVIYALVMWFFTAFER